MLKRGLSTALGGVLLAVALAACGATSGAPSAAQGEATAPQATAPQVTAAPTLTGQPQTTAATTGPATGNPPIAQVTVVPVPTEVGDTGEVPQAVVQGMIADLAGRLSIDPGVIAVRTAETVTWPDGAMGCPQPGMVYQQVLIEGYRVVLAVGDAVYPYHGAVDGAFMLCEQRRP
jgi:hypothetical protein